MRGVPEAAKETERRQRNNKRRDQAGNRNTEVKPSRHASLLWLHPAGRLTCARRRGSYPRRVILAKYAADKGTTRTRERAGTTGSSTETKGKGADAKPHAGPRRSGPRHRLLPGATRPQSVGTLSTPMVWHDEAQKHKRRSNRGNEAQGVKPRVPQPRDETCAAGKKAITRLKVQSVQHLQP